MSTETAEVLQYLKEAPAAQRECDPLENPFDAPDGEHPATLHSAFNDLPFRRATADFAHDHSASPDRALSTGACHALEMRVFLLRKRYAK